MLKTLTLLSKPLRMTSKLKSRAFAAAGQAGGALHTMAVLQAYQADLLKVLDDGKGLSPEAVIELRRTTDLTLRATKQTAAIIGRAMADIGLIWLTLGRMRNIFFSIRQSRPLSYSAHQSRLWSINSERRERGQQLTRN